MSVHTHKINSYYKNTTGILIPDQLFQCTFCKYKSSRKSNLKKHIMVHTKEKPFKCNDCNFSAASKSTLVLHIRTHTGEKPYECAICQRKFSRRNIIKAHIQTHRNEKPFQCAKCNFTTSRKDNLNFHMRRHLVDKPFKCHICACSFVQKCRLKRHLELHQKVFWCFSCCYQTHSEICLLKHKLSHFKTNSFTCFVCGRDFIKKCGLQTHMTKFHSRDDRRIKTLNWLLNCASYHNANITKTISNKIYIDKAIETDDNLTLSNDNAGTELLNVENTPQNLENPPTMHLHSFMCSSNNCNYSPQQFETTKTSAPTTEVYTDLPNISNYTHYSNLEANASLGSSSSDSEVDSVQYMCNSSFSGDVQQNVLQNLTVLNSDLYVNYQPNVSYIMGLNVLQPVVFPNAAFQSFNSDSPIILTSGFNNMQVNQNINYVPIGSNTNMFVNNLVSNVSDTNLMLNPNKPVFMNEMY